MKSISKFTFAAVAAALFTTQASAANLIAAGTVKSINSDKKTFVLTDSAKKDFTMTLTDATVFNRGGKEGKSSLKEGDAVNVCYEKGTVTWPAHYILIKDGDTDNTRLVAGTVKSFDGEKKELVVTDSEGTNWMYKTGEAKVRLNKEDSRIGEIKVGDKALLIVDGKGEKAVLKHVIANRK